MAHYLVTGGLGFIGSHLVDALQAEGHGVRVLDNLSTGKAENVAPSTEIIKGDVADGAAVAAAMAGMDGCFHLAAVASVAASVADWVGTHRTNLTGAITVFDAAKRVRADGRPIPVVYASSAAVYGDNPALPLSEQAATRPLTAYGADKLGCEQHARVALHVHGIPTVGLRFFNVYGPRQDPSSPYSGVISIFADRLGQGLPIEIFGDGEQTRDFVYVGDVVTFLLRAMMRESAAGAVVNVCTGRATSINELARTIAHVLGSEPKIIHRPARTGDIRASLGDPAQALRLLGHAASTSLADGLAQTMAATQTRRAGSPRHG
ncbi:MAG: NAD-dependent epimerase/dehydratase family protein [Defluviicoccus sp.]|nr:NAD-dependent epimerase/dehydratase family protein [Defluviicoccus sp.]MDG4609930.1 NAD-dependent epimerase/dehydratase family protein [Defluviicoccus sp.]